MRNKFLRNPLHIVKDYELRNFNDYSNICYGTNANKVYANKSYYMVFLRNLCWNL